MISKTTKPSSFRENEWRIEDEMMRRCEYKEHERKEKRKVVPTRGNKKGFIRSLRERGLQRVWVLGVGPFLVCRTYSLQCQALAARHADWWWRRR